MESGARIRSTVERLTKLVRQRRMMYYGLRGLAWGLALAVAPVLLRSLIGPWALWAAGGVALLGLLAGAVYGAILRVPAPDALRLADRTFALHDRLVAAHQYLGEPAVAPLKLATIEDAASRTAELALPRAVPWRWPREARFIPVPVLALVALPYLPPVPIPEIRLPNLTPAAEEEEKKAEKGGPVQVTEPRPLAKPPETAQKVEVQEREYAQRSGAPDREQGKGDLAAAFKDTNVASKRPDFSSFLRQGDERLRMLERVDSLPDLQRDFTQSQYKVMFKKSRNLLGGMDPRQMSPEKLRQLLDEMNRMGRRSGGQGGPGDIGQEMMEGSEALEQGQTSRALDAMERALSKLRSLEERERGGKNLDGGRDGQRGGRGRDGQRGGAGEGDGDFGPEGQGSLPGKGTNPGWRGDPTTRLGQNPIDMGVEGQSRKGRREAYDTNMTGRGAQNPSRLPSTTVISQYRKMMEEALAKESIPLDYRSQVRDYFQALEER